MSIVNGTRVVVEDRVLMLHMRMGHPPFELLKTYYPSMFRGIEVSKLFCEACQLAKHKHFFFKNLNHRCLSPFECIYNDVWGPCLFPSIFGCTWFVVLVDDCTQVTWLYLLKSKVEVSQVVLQFCEMISTQFGVVVKCFSSDNSMEFF